MPKSPVLAVAEAVSDAAAVDWAGAESSAMEPSDREAVRQLRLVAGIGQAARALATRWGPFELREQIGHGSFGTVYRAWDRRLDKEIALKLLHEGAASDTEVIHEARLLATVEHPNIVPVYGADVHDGRVGIWMKFIRGKTLKDILVEQGPFGAEEAAQIGRELCHALAAVHQKGFVHRDVKAQNVMREVGGRYLLMDFGAGDTVEAARDGSIKGSPAYLAPEVIAGEAPTAQSDIYSLGVLLYLLVSGQLPVAADTWEELRSKHASMERQTLADLRPDLPEWFTDVVHAALSTRPDQRPQSAGAFEQLLRRDQDAAWIPRVVETAGRRHWNRRAVTTASALMALVVAAVAGLFWSRPVTGRSNSAIHETVAVLAFTALGGSPEDAAFAQGVSSDIIANLGKLGDLRVVSFGKAEVAYQQAASQYGVAAVLEGSVRRADARVRIMATLVEVPSGRQIWTDTYDREFQDIFAIQSDVSRKIALALKGELAPSEAKLLEFRAYQNTEAFDRYLKGRYRLSLRTEDGFRDAVRWFRDALNRDDRFAPAYAGLADTYMLMGVYGHLPRKESMTLAYDAATTAVALDGNLAEAHAALGYIQKHRFEWAASEASLRRALEMRPGYALAHQYLGVLLTQFGRFQEALTELTLALSLEPLSVSANSQLAASLLLARHYDEAIVQANRVLQLEPSAAGAQQILGEAFAYKGDYDAALPHITAVLDHGSRGADSNALLADLGYVYAGRGERDKALAVAQSLKALVSTGAPAAASAAMVFAALDQPRQALDWLTIAWQGRELEIGYLAVDPKWDKLRSVPEFDLAIEKVGLRSNR